MRRHCWTCATRVAQCRSPRREQSVNYFTFSTQMVLQPLDFMADYEMSETAIRAVEELRAGQNTTDASAAKAAFSRLAIEVNSQYQSGSASAAEFISSAIAALKHF